MKNAKPKTEGEPTGQQLFHGASPVPEVMPSDQGALAAQSTAHKRHANFEATKMTPEQMQQAMEHMQRQSAQTEATNKMRHSPGQEDQAQLKKARKGGAQQEQSTPCGPPTEAPATPSIRSELDEEDQALRDVQIDHEGTRGAQNQQNQQSTPQMDVNQQMVQVQATATQPEPQSQ